jgi:nitroimidazol reductase NimA-like FMN-containing flavoprotein (pyridoxamine 5'-phosphate oxidase superfamily)
MRRKEREITDNDELNAIIRSTKVCRLGLSDRNIPYIVPLSFGYKDKTLYFHSAAEGKKIEILKRNPNVCFEFDQSIEVIEAEKPCNWGMRYRSIIGFGKACFLESIEEKQEALQIIMSQYTKESFTISETAVERTTLFKVIIDGMTGKKANTL